MLLYDDITGRVVFFSSTQDFKLDFSILENEDIKLNLGWMLGFRKHMYYYYNCYNNDSYITSIDNTIKIKNDDLCNINIYGFMSEGVVDLSGPRYLFLIINDYIVHDNKKNTYMNISKK